MCKRVYVCEGGALVFVDAKNFVLIIVVAQNVCHLSL